MRAAMRFAVAAATGAWMMGAAGCSLVVSAGDYMIGGTDGGSGSTGYCSDLLESCCPTPELTVPQQAMCEVIGHTGDQNACLNEGNSLCSKSTVVGTTDSGTESDGGTITVTPDEGGTTGTGDADTVEEGGELDAPVCYDMGTSCLSNDDCCSGRCSGGGGAGSCGGTELSDAGCLHDDASCGSSDSCCSTLCYTSHTCL